MGFPTSYSSKLSLLRVGATLALCALAVPAHADTAPMPQAANAPYSAPAAKLQVTGDAEKFSVDADHADAQSVLKAIFNQANAQFTVDNNVVGQVTMRLSDQSLPTTLDAVCKQLLIRYKKDAKGIYAFEQDTVAMQAAITRIKDQNALLRQQLRSLGLKVPEDNVLDSAPGALGPAGPAGPAGSAGANGVAAERVGGANRSFGANGGFGGGRSAAPASGDVARGGARGQGAPELSPRNGAKDDNTQNGLTGGLKYLNAQYLSEIFELNPQSNSLQNPDLYRAFIRQSGLVFINTGDQKAPVTEVLQELQRQSNTRILIDASVPTGPKFNLQGYITPRTLPEALNVLTQYSRLTWRWVGTSVYVEALPDFQLFFNSNSPRVIFGSQALPTQNGGQGQQSNNTNGLNYAPPSQIPLPITNGEKKTP